MGKINKNIGVMKKYSELFFTKHFTKHGAQLCADYLDALGPAPELPDALPAFVSLYGGTQVSASTLGIQHQKTLTAATFAQAEGMVKEMAEQGIPLWLTYANWEKNALKETIPDQLSPLSALGGQKALDSLEERLQTSGGRLFLEAQTVFFSQSGNGISANQHAAKDFNHSVSLQDRYSPSTGFMPSDETSYRMLGAFEAIRRLQTASVSLPGLCARPGRDALFRFFRQRVKPGADGGGNGVCPGRACTDYAAHGG